LIVGVLLSWWLPAAAAAQGTDYRAATSPFQQEFEYTVDSELRPMVEVDGVRWIRFAVVTREGREIVPDKPNPVQVEFDLLGGSENADVQLIILFEDEYGNALERLTCDPVKADRDRLREISQKHKVPGLVLQSTHKVYLYFEVTR
jgi:hypothetical protein